MVKYTKTKMLKRTFGRLRLDRNDLIRICSIFVGYKDQVNDKIQFEIEFMSIDGEDTIRSEDPEILSSEEVLRGIKVLIFSLHNYETKTRITLKLPEIRKDNFSDQEYASLSVQSNDGVLASGIFRELENELSSREIWGKGFRSIIDGLIGFLLLSYFCSWSVYSVFDFSLDTIYIIRPDLKETLLPVAYFGGVCMLLAMLFGGVLAQKILNKALPPVEYMGDLEGESSKYIKRTKWCLNLVIWPIIINLFASFIKDYIATFIT